jgi:hypothetical protein
MPRDAVRDTAAGSSVTPGAVSTQRTTGDTTVPLSRVSAWAAEMRDTESLPNTAREVSGSTVAATPAPALRAAEAVDVIDADVDVAATP